MLNSIKASIKDTFIFGFGNVAVKIIGFILIPLYTDPKYFSVDDFGIIGILDISGLVLISIFTTFLPQSLTRWYWGKDNVSTQKEIFFMSLLSQAGVSILFCMLLIPLSGSISALIFGNTDWELAIKFIIISSALQGINNIINTLLRLHAKSMVFMITNLLKLLTVLGLTIFFITNKEMGVEGIYLAQIIGNFLVILLLLPFTVRNCSVGFNRETLKAMIMYGLPLVLASFSAVMLNVIDRYTLNALTSLRYLAIYTLAYKISSSLKLIFVDTIKLAVFPQMIKRIDSPDNKRFYSKAMLYSSFALMFGIIGVSLFSTEVIKLLSQNPELWTAYVLVPVLSVSYFFMNLREVSVYGLIVAKKTHKIGLIVTISAVFNIVANLLLIPLWNAMGAAIATLMSQFLYWGLMHFIAQRIYFIPYENRKLLILFLTGTALSFAGFLMEDLDLIIRLLIKFLCLAAFPIILYVFNFYEPAELQAIQGFYKKWSRLTNLGENLKSLKNIKDEF